MTRLFFRPGRCVKTFTSLTGVALLVVGLSSISVAEVSRANTLAGQIDAPGTSDFAVRAVSSGDLPGVIQFQISLAGSAVVDGSWTLVVQTQNADGSWTHQGIVRGTVVGGSVTVTGDAISELHSVQLTVEEGTDKYAGASGAGTLDGTVAPEAAVQFSGNLALAF